VEFLKFDEIVHCIFLMMSLDYDQRNESALLYVMSSRLQNCVYGKKSFLSTEWDTKILESIYFAYKVVIINSYSNRITTLVW